MSKRKISRKWKKRHEFDPCHYCGVYKAGQMTTDHVYPLALGGSNFHYNLVKACQPCNSAKGNSTYTEFVNGV